MKAENKRCFVFVYDNLCIGGIQNYMYHTIKYLKKKNAKIVIVHKPKCPIDDVYKKEICDSQLTLYDKKKYHKKLKQLVVNCNIDDVTFITFTVADFANAEKMRNILQGYQIDVFYYVPNFKGVYYYLEETFDGATKEKIRKRMSSIIQKMHDNNQIRYFSIKHADVMGQQYGYSVSDFEDFKVPSYKEMVEFDSSKRVNVYRRKEFNLLTVSRFDFPHKGYIIGLIKAYGNLKKKYPHIQFTIVGYGAGLSWIEEEISKLDEKSRTSIRLVGKQSTEELDAFYDDANLNISLAGCCIGGAKRGVLSIPARHFTYDCEVYGYLPESKNMTTSDEPGNPVEPMIESIINMSEEEYLRRCKEGYEVYSCCEKRTSIYDRNVDASMCITNKAIKYILKINRKVCFWLPIRRYSITINREGIILPMKRKIRRYLIKR